MTFPLRHASNGMTANRLPLQMYGALGSCYRANRPRSCASIRAKSWYRNLHEVTTNGDYEVTFHLKRPQPSLIALLASGWSPIYPATCLRHRCARIRSAPDRSNSFEFKPNESIKVVRNPDYWKPGRPYLDGIEYTMIKEMSTRNLAFVAGSST